MRNQPGFSIKSPLLGAVLLVLSTLLVFQFLGLDVLQDDAFISFHYVRNFLDGHGLVFNIGERVEGYTNFFWIMLLAFLTKLGLPLIGTARVLGILAGIGTIFLAAYAARRHYPKRNWIWIFSIPTLLAINGALAYWAGSGLETALFTLLAAAAAATYFIRPAFALLFLALASLTRPEGGLLAFLFGITGILLKEKSWKQTATFWGALALLLLPFAVFKYFYYGSLLPNPFYAKTGFSAEYLQSGLSYVGLFLKHYAGYGLLLILPLLFWKKLVPYSRFCFLVFASYTLYVISVGGDVLQAHRFFVPILIFFFFPVIDSLYQATRNLRHGRAVFASALLLIGIYHYAAPRSYLKTTGYLQKGSVVKMTQAAHFLEQDLSIQTVAATAIGAFSYYLGDRRVLDMLGLVDTMVARHPEKIDGLYSTWRERNFNAGYILSQKPDVIQFSTGMKPSGFAERALFLYPDFRRNYRPEFSYHQGNLDAHYRRFQNAPAAPAPDHPVQFVNLFNYGFNRMLEWQSREAIDSLRKVLAVGPRDCSVLYIVLATTYADIGRFDSAETYLRKGLDLDEGGTMNRYYLSTLLHLQGRDAEAAVQDSILLRTMPKAAEIIKDFRTSR